MASGGNTQAGDSGRGTGQASSPPAFGDFLRSVQLGVAAVREGREPPPYSGGSGRGSETNELIVLVDTVLDELALVLARLQQVEAVSRSDAVMLLRERAAGLEATIKDLSERPSELALLDTVGEVASRLQAFETQIDSFEARVESSLDTRLGAVERVVNESLDESADEAAIRIDGLQEKVASIGVGVNAAASDLYQAVEQLLTQRLEDTNSSTLPRLDALEEQISAVNTNVSETLTDMYRAVEQLLAQRLEATAQTTVPRLDLLQERLGTLTTTMQDTVAQILQAFESTLDARLGDAFQESAARFDALQEGLTTDTGIRFEALALATDERIAALQEGLTADTAARFEALAVATDERIGALESSVAISVTSLVESLEERLEEAGSARIESVAGRFENVETERLQRLEEGLTAHTDAGFEALAAGTDKRITGLQEGLTAYTDAGFEALAAGTDKRLTGLESSVAASTSSLAETLEKRLEVASSARAQGLIERLEDADTERLQRLEAQIDSITGTLRNTLAALPPAIDRAISQRLDHNAEALTPRFESLEMRLTAFTAHVEGTSDGLLPAFETLIAQRLDAFQEHLAATDELSRRQAADARDLSQQAIANAGDRLTEQVEGLAEANRRLYQQLGRRVVGELTAQRELLTTQGSSLTAMLERSGPENAMPELLLAFGEAQEQAVTQALSQLGEGALRDFGNDLARVERITRELVGRNDATVSVLDIVKVESQEMASVVQEMANRVESSQAQVDGVRDSLTSIFDSVERLRGGQAELGSAFTQLRANSLQREDASSFMSQLAAVNAELLRHRGWLEDMSSHLHAINDGMAGLQAWTQRGAATFGKPADLGPSSEPGRF